MRLKHLAFLITLLQFGMLQAGSGFVFLSDTTKLFFVSDNEIYSPSKSRLLYFQKGNIFFNGTTDEKENIFLMTTSMNPASERLELLYEKDNREASFSFRGNKFYSGKAESEDQRDKNELIHIEKAKKWMAFYSSLNDSLLAYYNADSLSASTAILVSYTLIKKFELEKKLAAKPIAPAQTNSYSTLRPMWGNVTANEWMWDGTILRPLWNVDPRLAWTFDGQTIKPYYGNNIYDQYSWDGETFKPIWRNNRAQEWSWDGRILKPIWDTDWANQYLIENGVVKPWSNVHTEKEWQLDGDIPIPLIILILSGTARTY
jgi:hypothetical protein